MRGEDERRREQNSQLAPIIVTQLRRASLPRRMVAARPEPYAWEKVIGARVNLCGMGTGGKIMAYRRRVFAANGCVTDDGDSDDDED